MLKAEEGKYKEPQHFATILIMRILKQFAIQGHTKWWGEEKKKEVGAWASKAAAGE